MPLDPPHIQAEAGIKVVGPDTVDFGTYSARERKIARFRIRNAGKKTVRILRIYKTCICATAKCDKSELVAGEEASIEIVILPNSIYGYYSKPTYFENTDINNQFLGVTVKGTAVPLVEIKPHDFIYAGRVDTNKECKVSFDLIATESGVKLGKPELKGNHPAEATMNPVTGGGDSSNYRLNVRLLPIPASGDFQCGIKIPVLSPTNNPPLSLGITGKVGIEMIAFPGTFRLVISTNDVIRSFNLRVLGDSTRVFDPSQLKLPSENGVKCEIKRAGDGRTIDVSAAFSPEFVKEVFAQGKMELNFGMPGIASARVVCLPKK